MAIALVDSRIGSECERALMLRGFRVISMPKSRKLSEPLASHPDMLVFFHDGHLITTADYGEDAEYVFTDIRCESDITMHFSSQAHGEKYPYDALLNALVMGDQLFCKEDTVCEGVIDYARARGMKIIPVKQGYPACTVLPLDENHAITADRGMCDAMMREGIDVTLIEDGDISLPPYEYGFIGGAAGVYNGVVYFLGDARLHRSYDKIDAAIKSLGMSSIMLSTDPLSDLGRIIFIPEHSDNND